MLRKSRAFYVYQDAAGFLNVQHSTFGDELADECAINGKHVDVHLPNGQILRMAGKAVSNHHHRDYAVFAFTLVTPEGGDDAS